MHAVSLAFPLLALFAAAPEPVEEAVAEEAPSVAAELPAYFHVQIVDEKARVTVPVLADEVDAWSAAASTETDPSFPARLDALRPTTLVVAGATVAPGAFAGYRTAGGASKMWWVIVFEAKGLRDGEGVAILGDVDAPELRAPAIVSLASARGQEQLVAIRNVLDTKLSHADRRRLGKKVLSKTRVQIFDGNFPGGATTLVAVNVPMKGEPGSWISSMFTLTSDGDVVTMIHAPRLRLERFDPHMLGDVDADGFDDVTLSSAYYEGQYEHLLRWDDGKPFSVVLAGDGT